MSKRVREHDSESQHCIEEFTAFEFRERQHHKSNAINAEKKKSALEQLGPAVFENVTCWIRQKIPRVESMLARDYVPFLGDDKFSDFFSSWFSAVFSTMEDFLLVMLRVHATDDIIENLLQVQALTDSYEAVRDQEAVDVQIEHCLADLSRLISEDDTIKSLQSRLLSQKQKSDQEWATVISNCVSTLKTSKLYQEHTFELPPKRLQTVMEMLPAHNIRVETCVNGNEVVFLILRSQPAKKMSIRLSGLPPTVDQ